ncbi:unnamed protein product [Cuscuta campestris]|uniref:RRM domain-containing protein n=1 Tax=Cuscuta campestris TaxID=132261 RepID=A0A484LSZ2_9ASTE|nr:unnamed protein product [Cuscuta campestris]
MLNSTPLVATAAVASAATSSLSPSLPPYTKNLPLCHRRLSLHTPFHFLVRSKPIKHPKLNAHFSVIRAVTRPAIFHEDAQFAEADHEEDEDEVEEDEDEVEEEGFGSQSDGSGKLYVGNLPFALTPPELSEIFSEAGDVKNVEIIYDKVTRRSRGFAFVTMGSVEEADKAIRMFNESLVGGRTVKVNFPEVPKGGEREVMMASRSRNIHKLYAMNLAWSLTSQGLRQAFAGQPGFLNANVVFDRDSGKPLGYGFVSFASAEEMEAALNAMNGVEVQGRPLRLEFVKGRRPLSPSADETDR